MAWASPTMPATFSVPARLPLSPARRRQSRFGRRIPFAAIEDADALGPMEFVSRQREQVNLLLFDVNGHVGDSLHRIGVKQYAALPADGADLSDGLQRADFIVCIHNRDQRRVVPQGCLSSSGRTRPLLCTCK